ncbi:MAG: SDR family NAD(P)-dependent oxidoreductase [Bacteroidetes bacterium]|nr:SDR family NAD(P)-dependent oxidoreductase [Bacteroidota bacterium]
MKTAMITGATGAIGMAIATQMAKKDFKIVFVARNESKAIHLVELLKKESHNNHISYLVANISRKEEVTSIADRWDDPIDVLINNAAVTPRQREETAEGIEMQFATNVLGYFWMIQYFLPHLKKAKAARIVNVASYWAGNLDLDDLEFNRRHYDNDTAYRQSKQADRMLTVAFANRLKDDNITVNACHPGDVRSTLASNLGYGGHESPDQGAATPVWLSNSSEVEGITGKYFEHLQVTNCQFSQAQNAIETLFDICNGY